MIDERKYGVLVTKLNELKEFQLSLLKKRHKLIPNLKKIGYVQITVFTNTEQYDDSGPLMKKRAKLSVGNSKMFIETEDGIKFEINSKQIVDICTNMDTVKMQFHPNSWFTFCLLKFPNERIVDDFINSLPLNNIKTETVDETNNVQND